MLKAEERARRHLAAILAADVVGYARLMERDEADTFARVRAHRKELFEPEIEKHQGRVFKLMGDGLLAEFGSVVDAVECAVALQRGMDERNSGVAEDRRIDVRIGVNLGDVIVEGEDCHGEGVNIAARLQELAEPGGICISQQAFDQVETKLDLTYEDLGEHLVKNIVKAIHVYRVAGAGAHAARRLPKMRRPKLAVIAVGLIALIAIGGAAGSYWTRGISPPLTPGSRIAVLPFVSLSGTPDEPLSEGLTEDISSALSRFTDVFVISGDATGQFKGGNVEPGEVGRILGVSYVLAGSIRRSEGRLRVTARLLRAEDAELLSSDNYDRDLSAAQVLDVQAEIAGLVAGRIASPTGPLWKSEVQRISEQLRKERTNDLAAYECVLLSYMIYDSFSKDAHRRARDCLKQAVEVAPSYAYAWSRLGQMYLEEYKYKWISDPDPLGRARAAAQNSIELDQQHQDGYVVLALVHYMSETDFDPFYQTAEKAIALNPSDAWANADLGAWTSYSGDFVRGKALIERAKVLNPDYPRWLDFAFFLDHYGKQEYLEAKAVALKMDLPKNHMVQAGLAAAYGQLGELDKARAIIAQVLAIQPSFADNPRSAFVARRMPSELVDSLMDGLRKAGVDVAVANQ
jgi:class 3 adenylate cyclase/TolB-like protein/Tfp pilus assembly protein PilF